MLFRWLQCSDWEDCLRCDDVRLRGGDLKKILHEILQPNLAETNKISGSSRGGFLQDLAAGFLCRIFGVISGSF